MTHVYHAFAILATIVGCNGTVSATSSGGGGDACHPAQDNDPSVCAGNHCMMAPDGCGGQIFCDSACSASEVPASCSTVNGSPECFACVAAPSDNAICTNPDRSYAYHCPWAYPQPACDPKSTDGTTYVACCGGAK